MQRWPTVPLLVITCVAFLAGCGGGGDRAAHHQGPTPPGGEPDTGRELSIVEVEVVWPDEPYEVQSRSLPRATAAIQITLTAAEEVLLNTVLQRPEGPPWRRTETIGRVEPREDAVLEVTAFPTADCEGTPLASATVRLCLPSGQRAHLHSGSQDGPLCLELESLVERTVAQPESVELHKGEEVQLTAHAENAEGHVVVVPPDEFSWSIVEGNAVVDLAADGTLTARGPGTATISVTETGSGHSATVAVRVVATYDDLLTVAMNLDFTEVTNNPSPRRWDMNRLSEEIEQMMADSAAAGVDKILFRVDCLGEVMYPSPTHTIYDGAPETIRAVEQDGLRQCVERAHAHGMQLWAWIEIFESGYSAAGMWDQYFCDRPYLWLLRRDWDEPLSWRERELWFGMPCYAYPEARQRRVTEFAELASMYDIDGFYVCMRKHGGYSGGVGNFDFGYNPPIVEEYRRRWGVDPREVVDAADPTSVAARRFSQLKADYITQLIREARHAVHGLPLVVQIGYVTYKIDTHWTYVDGATIFGDGLSDRAWCWRVSRANALEAIGRVVPTTGWYRIYDWSDAIQEDGSVNHSEDGINPEMRARHAAYIRDAVRDAVAQGHDEVSFHEQYWFEVEDLYPVLREALDEPVP